MPELMNADQLEAIGYIPANASEGLKKSLAAAMAPFSNSMTKSFSATLELEYEEQVKQGVRF